MSGSKVVLLGALALLGGASLGVQPAQAQYGYGGGYDRPPPPDYDRRGPPPGDYGYERRRRDYDEPAPRGGYGGGTPQARGGFVQSCSEIRQDGFYLEATCRTKGGDARRSRIDVRSCRSIGNNNGRLVCE